MQTTITSIDNDSSMTKVIIFDLDDTLYNEVDYLEGRKLTLFPGTADVLTLLTEKGFVLGMITNGDTKTQMGKAEKLNLLRWFPRENIITAEMIGSYKPEDGMYRHFMKKYPGARFIYVGNNLEKDFLPANNLGWTTVCMLDNGRHIHPQDFTLPQEYLPQQRIHEMKELMNIIEAI